MNTHVSPPAVPQEDEPLILLDFAYTPEGMIAETPISKDFLRILHFHDKIEVYKKGAVPEAVTAKYREMQERLIRRPCVSISDLSMKLHVIGEYLGVRAQHFWHVLEDDEERIWSEVGKYHHHRDDK